MSDTTCIHHTDSDRPACPVCLVAKLRSELEHWREIATTSTAEREHNANAAAEITVHRDQLRAELAAERARLDHVLKSDWPFRNRDEIDKDIKEAAK